MSDVKMILNEYSLLNFTGKCPNGDNFLLTVAPEQLAQCRDRKEIILCLKFAAINLSVWIDPDQLSKIVDLCEEYNERSA